MARARDSRGRFTAKKGRSKTPAPARIVNLLELGQIFDRSANSLRDFIRDHPDFLVLSRGGHGRAWEIDLDAALPWWRAHHDAEDAKANPGSTLVNARLPSGPLQCLLLGVERT